MMISIKAPALPESIADGMLFCWHVAEGDAVVLDQLLAEIETDKVVLEVVAVANGVVGKLLVAEGETILSEQVLMELAPASGQAAGPAAASAEAASPVAASEKAAEQAVAKTTEKAAVDRVAGSAEVDGAEVDGAEAGSAEAGGAKARRSGPAARQRRRKAQDVAEVASPTPVAAAAPAPAAASPAAPTPQAATGQQSEPAVGGEDSPPAVERVPMSRLRRTIASRMKQARQETAMLTTFNEVDMTAVSELRRTHRAAFEAAHGVRLSIMSFFIRACALALKNYRVVNASIDGDDILYHRSAHIGVAVSTKRGLVVPVLRNANALSLAQTEQGLAALAEKARTTRLIPEDLMGGTFTISNGGVFGSLMSTPLLNTPQSAILGMHTIKERPIALDGQVVIRPMMYLALSYDHRLIDGREAVGFLVSVRDMVQNPSAMLLDI